MGDIYGQGQCLNIWFGECPKPRHADWYLAITPLSSMKPFDVIHHILGVRAQQHLRRAVLTALQSSDSLWHKRLWTIQEFVLSEKVFALFGPVRARLDHFVRTLSFRTLDLFSENDRSLLRDLYAHIACLYEVKWSAQAGTLTVLHCNDFCGDVSATDPRDHVFSLIGLVNGYEAKLLHPDYTKVCAEVFATATYTSLYAAQEGSKPEWSILSEIEFRETRRGEMHRATHIKNLPSWALDFTQRRERRRSGSLLETAGARYLEKFKFGFHPEMREAEEGVLRLATTGIFVDKVSQILRFPGPRQLSAASDECKALSDERWAIMISLFIFIREAAHRARSADILIRQPETSIAFGSHDSWATLFSLVSDHIEFSEWRSALASSVVLAFELWNYLCRLKPISRHTDRCRDRNIQEKEIDEKTSDARALHTFAESVADHCRVFSTARGFVGIGQATMAPGDVIAIFPQCARLVTLRPSGRNWRFRGFVWVHGFIEGEILAHLRTKDFEKQEFTLI